MSRMLSTLLAVIVTVAMSGAPLESQGKGQGNDKGNKGNDKARAADNRQAGRGNASRAASQGRGNQDQARADDRGRGNAKANRGNSAGKAAADNRGRARAAEVREVGGAVAGPADAAIANRSGRAARNAVKNGKFSRAFDPDDAPDRWRRIVVSPRLPERYVGRVATLALARGVPENALVITPSGDRYLIANNDGVVLLDLDEQRARNLGAFRVVTLDDVDDGKEGSPAFCRSGAGHPNWGRQWCIDKGFGLGSDEDLRWGRAISTENVILRPTSTTGDLTRDVLASVLGDIVFNRLAAHAITLGLVDPLVGRWAVEPSGRRVLFVNSGTAPVAELVDANDDNQADVLLVTLKAW